jgi:HAD superfamily hydrolase (TIGR01490 family)
VAVALVLVDVDGTLLRVAHSEPRFAAHLVGRGCVGLRQLLAYAEFAFRGWRRYGWELLRKNKAYLCGLRAEHVARLGERFVAEHLFRHIRSELVERLRAHAERGDRLVLLTGTPDFLAWPLARRVGVPRVVATVCATDGSGRYSAAAPRVHPYGEEKRVLAERLCAVHGTTLADCVAYANSASDLPLLRAVGTPVAVAPDAGLAAAARRSGWRVIEGRAP